MAGPKQGSCLCGALRFTASPKDHEVGACHCSMCRRWAAGPFMVMDCGATVKVENESNLGVCKKCGSVLFYRLVQDGNCYVSAEAFDDRAGYALTSQVFIDEKPAYYEFANKTHNMTGAEVFAAFGAPPPGSQGKD
jgi:hypothetical protein